MGNLPLIQANQFRVVVGAVTAGTSTLNYYVDTRSGGTLTSPILGAANINPTTTYSAPADALTDFEHLNEGFDELTVAVFLDTATTGGVPTVALYSCDDISGTNAVLMDNVTRGTATLTSTALTGTTDDDKLILLDVNRITGRFVNIRITRATQNIALNGVLAVLSKPRRYPVQQHTTVYDQRIAYES